MVHSITEFLSMALIAYMIHMSGGMNKLFETLHIRDNDAFRVKWAHGVNSIEELHHCLMNSSMLNDTDTATSASRPMMIESDVIIDDVTGQPVMAHPPMTSSNLSFETWLKTLMNSSFAGAKADFKTMDAVITSLRVLNETLRLYNFTKNPVMLWFNADICKGPADSSNPVIDGRRFIELCYNYAASGHVMSLGWTTPLFLPDDQKLFYDQMAIFNMKELVGRLPNHSIVTYAVRAKLIASTDSELFKAALMVDDDTANNLSNNSSSRFSITVWTSVLDELDQHDYNALSDLRTVLGRERVFFDLPSEDMTELRKLIP